MELLQKIYIILLNHLFLLTGKVNEKIRNAIITVCCFSLTASFVVYFTKALKIKNDRSMLHFVCCMIIFVMIMASLNKPLKPVRWNKLIFYTFFLAGLGIFVTSLLHPVGDGYRAFSFIMMFGFPCLYFVWNNRGDYEELYNRLAASTAVVGILYYIYYSYLASKGELNFLNGRVCVTFYDPNMFSMIGMIAVNAAFYMLLVNRESPAWFALTSFSMGIGLSIVYLGGSRLSMLVVAGSLFSFLVFLFKTRDDRKSNNIKTKVLKTVIVAVSIVIFVMIGNLMLSVNNTIVVDRTLTSEAFDGSDAVNTDDTSENPEVSGENVDNNDVIDRIVTSTQEASADSFLSGRLTLWKNYSKFLNLTGNDFSKTDWKVMTEGAPDARHAHNNFFEIAYRCGVPVACIHIFLELIAGIICLIWLFGRKYREPFFLFCIVSMVCYALESMFDIATLPFERPAPFYFYMAMIPIFVFRCSNQDQ